MEQHQVAEIENRNEKEEEIVSSSPDSGINVSYEDGRSSAQSDVHSEKASNAEKRILGQQSVVQPNSLYPFYYKYPDNRKLTLLKSLSQDSEYSLDASLFDAEGFLQEMGFAGSCDPIIPDRFLPSLIQRLSQFPETEMESLNDRIVQSIGCFRRKEGKRRLFRNLSIGKDSQSDPSHRGNLSCPNNYPLLRSNTGPAAFSFDDPSSVNESTESSRYSKLISNDSNNSSFAEDDLFPTSPIAILVSAASIDADNEENILEESPSCDVLSRDFQTSCLENSNQPTVGGKDDGESGSVSVVVEQKIQEDASLEDSSSKLADTLNLDFSSNEINNDSFSKAIVKEEQSEVRVQLKEFENAEISQTNADDFSVDKKPLDCSFQTFTDIDESIKPTIIKQPLRRLSEGSFFNLRNFSMTRELKTSDFSKNFNDNVFESFEKPDESDSVNTESVNVDSSIEFYDSSTSVSVKDDSESFHDAHEQESVVPIGYETPSSIEMCSPATVSNLADSSKRSKPKYTRDDSLSNFLSSMLNTNDESLSPTSPTASHVFTFDAKATNNERKNSETFFDYTTLLNDSSLKNVPDKPTVTVSQKIKNESSKLLRNAEKDKLPNRKRRLLRRMSSSLNYGDEEVPPIVPEPMKNQGCTSSSFSPPTNFMQSKQPIRGTFSAPMISSCPIIYPCCCLPAVNVSSFYGCQSDDIQNSCDSPYWSSRWNSTADNHEIKTQTSLPNRKYKRSHKRGRYLSCPVSMNDYGCNTCLHQRNLSKSTQNLCTETTNDFRHYPTNFHSKSFTIPRCSECFSRYGVRTSSKEYLSDPQNSESIRNVPRDYCNPSYSRPLSHDVNFSYKLRNSHPIHNKWSSTPDVRYEYSKMSNCTTNSCDYKSCDTRTNVSDKLSNEYTYHSPVSRQINSSKHTASPKSGDFGLNRYKVYPFPKQRTSVVRDLQDKSSLRNTQFLSSSKNELNNETLRQNLSPSSQYINSETNYRRTMPLRACNSYPLQDKDNSEEDLNYNFQNRRSSYVDERSFQDSNDSAFFRNNKREVLMEKKIRVFSKFLTNLGNLSKSISNDKNDNNRNSTSEQKCHDFAPLDKTMRSYLYSNQDKHLKPDKCKTSSPEFGKLLKILNSMELNKSATDVELPKEDSSVFHCVSPIYENSVSLELSDNSQSPQHHVFTPISYTSSVSMIINNDDDSKDSTHRSDKESVSQSLKEESRNLSRRNSNIHRYSLQMPFKEVSRDLQELQLSIKKAKEMRISASKELHLLQELLSKDTHEEHEIVNEKNFSISQQKYQNEKGDGENKDNTREALADLRKNSAGGSKEETFWQEEIKKMKEENDAVWQSKLDILEKRLASQEEELHIVQSANETLQKQLELQTSMSHSCHCRTDVVQNGVGRTDSAFEDDEDYMNHKSSIPIHSSRQECERLQEQLLEAEQRADQLNLLYNQKLIELNKLQLTFSKQTKEMIELEKSYLQLQHRSRKGTTKPMVARLCSRTSPFNSKNLCPKPSPPATPNP
ncbi:serine-rich adhesin for platelets isoform X2 [Parasteatoda tepidariorum]|uniref:serine-rich adhesin for platelets isoform X2 n=1 Tax=Parasteatoda tepidariorum TaxID=114398 RepID=UPI001C71D00B|nr:uncharacterized protein LOC107455284 isoform X2 [Parasteatoda tepidariorum]